MKKILIIAVLSIFVLYTGVWFIAANIAENKIQEQLANLQKDGVVQKYSADIKVKGFPFHFDIALEQPSFQISGHDYIEGINVLYDGSLRLRIGLFSSSIKLITNGDLHFKSKLHNNSLHIVSTGENTSYRVGLTDYILSPSTIKKLTAAADNPSKLLSVISRITITGKNLKTTNKTNNSEVFSASDVYINLNLDIDDQDMKLELKEEISKAKFSEASLVLWDRLMQIPNVEKAISGIDAKVRNFFAVFSLPSFGEMNHKISLDLKGKGKKYDIDINTLDIHDGLEKISLSGDIKTSNKNDSININGKTTFSSQWYKLMERYIDLSFNNNSGILDTLKDIKILDSIFGPITKGMKIKSPPKNKGIINWSELGTIKSKINIKTDKQKEQITNINVQDCVIDTDKFTIDASGTIKDSSNYKMNIAIDHYKYVLNAVMDHYLGDIPSLSEALTLGIVNGKSDIAETIRKQVMSLLIQVSDKPDHTATKASWTISASGSKYPAIGKYSSEQVEQLINELIVKVTTETINKTLKSLSPKDIIKTPHKILESIPNLFG